MKKTISLFLSAVLVMTVFFAPPSPKGHLCGIARLLYSAQTSQQVSFSWNGGEIQKVVTKGKASPYVLRMLITYCGR